MSSVYVLTGGIMAHNLGIVVPFVLIPPRLRPLIDDEAKESSGDVTESENSDQISDRGDSTRSAGDQSDRDVHMTSPSPPSGPRMVSQVFIALFMAFRTEMSFFQPSPCEFCLARDLECVFPYRGAACTVCRKRKGKCSGCSGVPGPMANREFFSLRHPIAALI